MNFSPDFDPDAGVTVACAGENQSQRAAAVYAAMGYNRIVSPADTVWFARAGGGIIGIVRVAPEQGTLVLRGMRIAGEWQRRGIGTRMIQDVADWLSARECYCIPFTHLTGFYGQVGFAEISPAQAPAFLADRLSQYRREGLDAVLMVRRAA